jgi:hypothetical protein
MNNTAKSNTSEPEDAMKSVGDVIGFILIGVVGPLVGVLCISLLLSLIFPIDEIRNPWGISSELFAIQIIVCFVLLILKLIIVFWIYKATMEKGMPSPPTWSLMALFFTFITLLLYYYNKPDGELVECQICGKKKLDILCECPHCKVRKKILPKASNRKRISKTDVNEDMGKKTPKSLIVKKRY